MYKLNKHLVDQTTSVPPASTGQQISTNPITTTSGLFILVKYLTKTGAISGGEESPSSGGGGGSMVGIIVGVVIGLGVIAGAIIGK